MPQAVANRLSATGKTADRPADHCGTAVAFRLIAMLARCTGGNVDALNETVIIGTYAHLHVETPT
jgi:hypothetical protein